MTGEKICVTCYLGAKRKASVVKESLVASEAEPAIMRSSRKGYKHPGDDILERLIKYHQANLSLIAESLFENQGIEVSKSAIAGWIRKDEKLRALAVGIRKDRTRAKTIGGRRIPLSEIELKVLCTPGESVEEISKRIFEEGGREGGGSIKTAIRSILLKEGKKTLEEVRRKRGIVLEPREEAVKK